MCVPPRPTSLLWSPPTSKVNSWPEQDSLFSGSAIGARLAHDKMALMTPGPSTPAIHNLSPFKITSKAIMIAPTYPRLELTGAAISYRFVSRAQVQERATRAPDQRRVGQRPGNMTQAIVCH